MGIEGKIVEGREGARVEEGEGDGEEEQKEARPQQERVGG